MLYHWTVMETILKFIHNGDFTKFILFIVGYVLFPFDSSLHKIRYSTIRTGGLIYLDSSLFFFLVVEALPSLSTSLIFNCIYYFLCATLALVLPFPHLSTSNLFAGVSLPARCPSLLLPLSPFNVRCFVHHPGSSTQWGLTSALTV